MPSNKKRLEDASALANKLHAEMYGDGANPTPTEPTPPVTPIEPVVPPEPVIPPEPIVPAITEPGEPPPAMPIASSEPAEPTETVKDDWEHKYKVLQGMYNKMNEDLKSASKDIETLNNVLASLRDMPSPELVPAKEDPPVSSESINALKSEYPSIFNGIKDYVAGELREYTQTTIAPTTSRIENVEATSLQDKKRIFYKALEDTVPDWAIVNNDPEFIQGLQEREPYSGAAKQQLLTSAYDSYDAERVIKFFTDFKALKASNAPPDLEGRLHPDTSPGGPTVPTEPDKGKEVIPGSYITKFYTDLSGGKYRGKAKIADEIRQKIDKAVTEGRVAVNK